MIRDSLGDAIYWQERVGKDTAWIEKSVGLLSRASQNPAYDPQFSLDISRDVLRLMLRQYGRGDDVTELNKSFPALIELWELSNRLSIEVCEKNNPNTPNTWIFDLSNLNHYVWCFWMVGLAILLDVPNEQWSRLIALVGEEGRDSLLDEVIATRQPGRAIGTEILHIRPYGRLMKAIKAPKDQQSRLLREFLDSWYPELDRRGKDQPWWYVYGDSEKNPLNNGSYFGRWCVEAAVCAKVFKIDDAECLGHDYYPGDLLRPDGPSTHRSRAEVKKKRWFDVFKK